MITFFKNDKNNKSLFKKEDILKQYKSRNTYGGINIDLLEYIKTLLYLKNKSVLKELIKKLHYADVSELIERLNMPLF